VRVTLIPSAVAEGAREQTQFLSSYLFNGTVAIDAGCIGFYRGAPEQATIRHVLLTHTHIDHLASLPIFVENAFEAEKAPVVIHGSDAVLDCLRRDLFNDRVWPDFIALSAGDTKFLRLERLTPGRTVAVEGLRFTPVEVNHVVPTFGFIVEDDKAAVVVSSDTGPTAALWEYANHTPNLKAVFLEATFPDALAELADVSKHLTPATFVQELSKLHQPAAIIAVHIKARYRDRVVDELQALRLPRLEVGRFGASYDF
jgi:ribonuclease BN (tRNA processing enzyme)